MFVLQNGLAPVARVLDDAFGIEKGLMTTFTHIQTPQPILDGKDKKIQEKEELELLLTPSTTGAAKSYWKSNASFKWKIKWSTIRVPTQMFH